MKKIKMFIIKSLLGNLGVYAHSPEEALEKYSKGRDLQSGDMLRINNKFYRYVGGKLLPCNKDKK